MRIIGLDLGSKTLGIAISDELGMLARALETYRFPEDKYDMAVDYIVNLCQKENVKEIVLGLPKHMNGDCGIRAEISFNFKDKIEKKAPINVHLVDERLTTSIVDKAMIMGNLKRKTRKEKKDEMAAVVILQNYLDKRR